MRIRDVGASHYICRGDNPEGHYDVEVPPSPRVSDSLREFWMRVGLRSCDRAVVVTDGGEIVACFRYYTHRPAITAAGTWVSPRYRRQGLAFRMWKRALNKPWIKKVFVTRVSKGGIELVDALKGRYKRIQWKLS